MCETITHSEYRTLLQSNSSLYNNTLKKSERFSSFFLPPITSKAVSFRISVEAKPYMTPNQTEQWPNLDYFQTNEGSSTEKARKVFVS
jgi:hypothetical protein